MLCGPRRTARRDGAAVEVATATPSHVADPQPLSRAKAHPARPVFYIDPLASRLRLDLRDIG